MAILPIFTIQKRFWKALAVKALNCQISKEERTFRSLRLPSTQNFLLTKKSYNSVLKFLKSVWLFFFRASEFGIIALSSNATTHGCQKPRFAYALIRPSLKKWAWKFPIFFRNVVETHSSFATTLVEGRKAARLQTISVALTKPNSGLISTFSIFSPSRKGE